MRRALIAVAALAVAATGVWLAARPHDDASEQPATPQTLAHADITGLVVDDQGHGVGGARIRCVERPAESAVSLDDGTFELNDLGPGLRTLEITSDELAPSHVEVSSPAEHVTIALVPGAFVSGAVFDRAGRPLAIPVRSSDPVARVAAALHPRTATDVRVQIDVKDVRTIDLPAGLPDGGYRSSPLEKGTYEVCATLPPRIVCRDVVLATGEHVQLDLSLTDALAISGFVTDETGRPIFRATLTEVVPRMLLTTKPSVYGDSPATAITDTRGAFAFEAVAPGEHTFTAEALGFGVGVAHLRGGQANVVIRLTHGGLITGRVVGDDGPLSSATVEGKSVGADGRFELNRDGAEGMALLVRAKGYADFVEYFHLGNGDVVDVGDLQMVRGERIAGVVTDASGAPLAGVRMHCFTPSDQETDSDAMGRFALEHVKPGTHLLTATKDSWVRAALNIEGAKDDLHVTLSHGMRLGGTVVDEQGQPVARVALVLEGSAFRTSVTVANDTGEFELNHVPAGKLSCHGVTERVEVPPTEIDIEEGKDVSLTLHARSGGTLLRLKNLPPSVGAKLFDGVVDPKRLPAAFRSYVPYDGDLLWSGLPAGQYSLVIHFGDRTGRIVKDIMASGTGVVEVTLTDVEREQALRQEPL
jgi:hypothetical protein